MAKNTKDLSAELQDLNQSKKVDASAREEKSSSTAMFWRKVAAWIGGISVIGTAAATPVAGYGNARMNSNDQLLERQIADGIRDITGKEVPVVCHDKPFEVTPFIYAPSSLTAVLKLNHQTCDEIANLKTVKKPTESLVHSTLGVVFAAVNIAKPHQIETKGQANCVAVQLVGRFAANMGMANEAATTLQHNAAHSFIYTAVTPAEHEIAIPENVCRSGGALDVHAPGNDIRFPLAGNVRRIK
ncbi:MAG TPA: hypothetical protein VF733_06890 [Candidatus Saccharimonadales bacterium]